MAVRKRSAQTPDRRRAETPGDGSPPPTCWPRPGLRCRNSTQNSRLLAVPKKLSTMSSYKNARLHDRLNASTVAETRLPASRENSHLQSAVGIRPTLPLRHAGPTASESNQKAQPALPCRVGAGLAPGAPHGPVREQFTHTVRQHPPVTGQVTLRVTTPQGDMTVAAHQNTCWICGSGSAKGVSTLFANRSQLIGFFEFLRPSHFFHFIRVCS